MADKHHSDTQEKIEALEYNPGLQNSGDLEGATNTITATSEAAGVGSADYSKALTLPKPDDARIEVKRIGTRLSVTIDSDDGTHDLHCRVYVDAQDAAHMLFDETWTDAPAVTQLAAQSVRVGTKETIFDLLRDGNAHTFYFFFWSPGNHSPVISLVQLWEAVGVANTEDAAVLTIAHQGWGQLGLELGSVGSGAPRTSIFNGLSISRPQTLVRESASTILTMDDTLAILDEGYCVSRWGMAAADLSYIVKLTCVLRSEL